MNRRKQSKKDLQKNMDSNIRILNLMKNKQIDDSNPIKQLVLKESVKTLYKMFPLS